MSTIPALWRSSTVNRSHVGAIISVREVHVYCFCRNLLHSAFQMLRWELTGNISLRQLRFCQKCCWRFRSPDVTLLRLSHCFPSDVTTCTYQPTKRNTAVESKIRNIPFSCLWKEAIKLFNGNTKLINLFSLLNRYSVYESVIMCHSFHSRA
jgi:hypothetical protein